MRTVSLYLSATYYVDTDTTTINGRVIQRDYKDDKHESTSLYEHNQECFWGEHTADTMRWRLTKVAEAFIEASGLDSPE